MATITPFTPNYKYPKITNFIFKDKQTFIKSLLIKDEERINVLLFSLSSIYHLSP